MSTEIRKIAKALLSKSSVNFPNYISEETYENLVGCARCGSCKNEPCQMPGDLWMHSTATGILVLYR